MACGSPYKFGNTNVFGRAPQGFYTMGISLVWLEYSTQTGERSEKFWGWGVGGVNGQELSLREITVVKNN